MKYQYYRCENCGSIVSTGQIIKAGKCAKCSKKRVNPAYFFGYNMPRPWEFILIWLGVR